MSGDLQRELNRLVNLKQNQGKTEDELLPIAKINLEVRNFHSNPIFTDANEQKLAEEKFRNYLETNELDSASDIDTLKSLIFNEIFEYRLQGELNKIALENKYPPDKLVKTLVEVQNQKSSLKIKLGIDRKEEDKDDFSALQLLQKRVDKYINENKNEFTIGLGFECEECHHKNFETFLLYKKVKDFSMLKHPFFIGRWLANYEIIKDVKEGKITKEQAYRYLMCSGQGHFYKPSSMDKEYCLDYINYLLENWTEITDLMNP